MLPVVAALALVESSASAQPRDPERQRTEARAAFRDGMAAWREGDHVRAAALFRQAQSLSPHPDTQFNVARAEERAGNTDAAITAYEEYLRQAPAAPDVDAVRAVIARLRASLPPVVTPPVVTPPVVTPPVVTPPVVTPPVVTVTPPVAAPPVVPPPSTYDRITERRRRRVSFRLGLIGGFAAPRDRQNLAVGVEATMFIGRSLTLLGHGLFIDTEGAPKVVTGEAGWTFVGDDFDLGVLAHAGVLLECDSVCREGTLRGSAVFLGGITLKVDVLFHPRLSVGLYGRFSWQDLNLLSSDALLSSIGLSVSFHL